MSKTRTLEVVEVDRGYVVVQRDPEETGLPPLRSVAASTLNEVFEELREFFEPPTLSQKIVAGIQRLFHQEPVSMPQGNATNVETWPDEPAEDRLPEPEPTPASIEERVQLDPLPLSEEFRSLDGYTISKYNFEQLADLYSKGECDQEQFLAAVEKWCPTIASEDINDLLAARE